MGGARMRKTGITGALMIAFAWAGMHPASAQNCQLKLVNTLPIRMTAGGLRPLVPVLINGTEKTFLLDTGGAATQIGMGAAQELKLSQRDGPVRMLDLYGHSSARSAVVENFVLGRLKERNAELPIAPGAWLEAGGMVSGLLSADYMAEYDVELDFGGGKMNFFAKDHCEGKVVYWNAPGAAVVPMLFRDHHLIVQVLLNGKPFKAIIDTGAPRTTLFDDEAKRVFDITESSPGSVVKDAGPPPRDFEYVFDSLNFEGISISKPRITVIPDIRGKNDPNNHMVTGTRLMRQDDRASTEPAMLIGMNILNKLRLFISFAEDKIYITPATTPVAQ